jgi:hypothetical protein
MLLPAHFTLEKVWFGYGFFAAKFIPSIPKHNIPIQGTGNQKPNQVG